MSEIWSIILTNVVVFAMVLARTTGIFTFNPIMSRRGIPNSYKAGMSLVLAAVMTAGGDFNYTLPSGLFPFVFDFGKELLVGAVLGFLVNLMIQVFSYAGEIVDMQIGLTMAKSYDPTFGSAGIATQYYSLWFMTYFFVVGGHKSYISLCAMSYESIPLGWTGLNINVFTLLVYYFESVITLGVKLAMPIIAAELITEFCIGIMMKAVPTIHVFVLNIQLKMLVGFVVLVASAGVTAEFMDKLMGIMFENLNGIMKGFLVSG